MIAALSDPPTTGVLQLHLSLHHGRISTVATQARGAPLHIMELLHLACIALHDGTVEFPTQASEFSIKISLTSYRNAQFVLVVLRRVGHRLGALLAEEDAAIEEEQVALLRLVVHAARLPLEGEHVALGLETQRSEEAKVTLK